MRSHGLSLPTATPAFTSSSRVNNMLAIIKAMKPDEFNQCVLDVSQSVHMTRKRSDGCVPTISTSSCMWSAQLRRQLTVSEQMILMGFNPARYGESTPSQRMVGNTMHVCVVGYVILSALLAMCPQDGNCQRLAPHCMQRSVSLNWLLASSLLLRRCWLQQFMIVSCMQVLRSELRTTTSEPLPGLGATVVPRRTGALLVLGVLSLSRAWFVCCSSWRFAMGRFSFFCPRRFAMSRFAFLLPASFAMSPLSCFLPASLLR